MTDSPLAGNPLTVIRDQTFDSPVDVDDRHFIGCRFGVTQLRFGGGELPRFEDCTFERVGWYFHGAALRTIQLLQMQNTQGEGQQLIDEIFRPGNVLSE